MLEAILCVLSILGCIVLGQTIILMVVLINIKRHELKQTIEMEANYVTPMQSALNNYLYEEKE